MFAQSIYVYVLRTTNQKNAITISIETSNGMYYCLYLEKCFECSFSLPSCNASVFLLDFACSCEGKAKRSENVKSKNMKISHQ